MAELSTGHNMTAMHSGHNMTAMHTGHNMTDMHTGHNMTDMHTGHTMTDMHTGHNMTDMHIGHNMTATHSHMTPGMTNDHMTPGMTNDHMTPGMHGGHDNSNQHLLHGTGHQMKMYFHTGNSEYVLFEDIYTSSDGGLVGACVVIFVAAILYEGLKAVREVLLKRSLQEATRNEYSVKELDRNMDNSNGWEHARARMFNSGHFLQVFLHVVQMLLSYCLMLVFMTFNVWLCLAVIVGAGFGYFLFGWKRASVVDANEHCH